MYKWQVGMFVISALLYCGAPCQADTTKPLQVKLSMDKEVFLLHEPIWLDVWVINPLDFEQQIPGLGLASGTLRIQIKASDGTILEYTGPRILADSRDDLIIAPGDSIHAFFELTEAYGVRSLEGKKGIPCGTYSVNVRIAGGLESESLQFKVEEPSGLAKTAHELYISAITKKFAFQKAEAFADLRTLIEQSPSTVYLEPALFEIIKIFKFTPELGSVVDPCIELLERIPNTGYADYVIFTLNNSVGKDSTRSIVESVLSKGHYPRLEVMVERISEKGEL